MKYNLVKNFIFQKKDLLHNPSFFLVAFSAITFQACRKEAFTEQLSSSSALKNPITSDAAKAWFQNQFGETKLISPSNSPTSFTGDTSKNKDEFYFDESFEISPLWTDAEIASYLKTNPILLVPIKPISFLDKKEMHYVMVVFRDSLGSLNARLQAYRATESYKKSHTAFSVNDFTGLFYQIAMDGLIQNVYAIDNGVVKNRIFLEKNQHIGKSLNGQGAGCNCFDGGPGAGILDEIGCVIACAVNAIANLFIVNPGDTGGSGYLDYGNVPNIGSLNTGGIGNIDNVGADGGIITNPTGNLSNEIDNTFFNVNGAVNWAEIHKAEVRTKYLNAGFTAEEFEKIFFKPNYYSSIQALLQNPNLTEAEKIIALKEFKNEIDWDEVEKTDIQTEPIANISDPGLDLVALENNPYFTQLNTVELRRRIGLQYPNLEQRQINISAGVALENAYGYFTGYNKGFNAPASPKAVGSPKTRVTRPDFHYATSHTDLNTGEVSNFDLAGKVEVKAPQGAITLKTNGWQIAAEIAMAADAFPNDYLVRAFNGETPIKSAGYYKSGAYTLVLPYGTLVDPEVEKECTKHGVNFYISYAFIGQNGEVVFSNPKKQNPSLSPENSTSPGKLNRGAIMDFEKATVYWRDNAKKANLGKETNNALDGTE